MKIDLKETLEHNLKSGVNLFLGAGFSIYAKDVNDKTLPLGAQLSNELIDTFACPPINDLTKVCTVIDSVNSDGLKEYLTKRFTISTYNSFYDNLIKINCPRIFTTNIDNLVDSIFEKTTQKYISNVFINGSCFQDSKCVEYIPIHGSVDMPEIKFLFNKQEVSGSFRTEVTSWVNLNISAQQLPSVFLGYSLEDVGAVEALFGSNMNKATQKDKWILLHKSDPGTEAYFKALGFKIIIGDIKEFLEYVGGLDLNSKKTQHKSDDITSIYPESCVPKSNYKGRVRQIDEFFLGSAPIWSDILSNRIHQTNHLDVISNMIEKSEHLIVTGIPASGKSTLLLQLAKKISQNKRVLYFNELSFNKTNIIKNEIKRPTIILVDNFTSDIDSFLNLTTNSKIKLVGFDRYYNVDISGHKLPNKDFNFHDISDLSQQDIQGIYNTIPLPIRKNKLTSGKTQNEIPSIFEIVNYNINKPDIKERYISILNDLDASDPILLDLLIMTCYVHSCRTPVSFEVANSFLGDDVQNYNEVLEIMNSLHGMVDEVIGDIIDDLEIDQDYYQPRSQILAETIISQTKQKYFRRVFERFHENVPKHQIPNFYAFKRQGYDSNFVAKAFSNWEDGLDFYEQAYYTDKNPFLLQQCALYLLKKRKYTEAALKIDKAIQISKKRFFSIENTHAIILFKANINATSNDSNIRITLDKSMNILKQCYEDDQRKTYHAVTFAEQALDYYTKYPDMVAKDNLKLAKVWLLTAQKERKYNQRLRQLIKTVSDLI